MCEMPRELVAGLAVLALAVVVESIPQRDGGAAVRRALQTTAATAFQVTTNGAEVESEIQVAGQHQWFSFNGRAGYSYQIETVLGTASDTIIDLVDVDRSTVLVENDDDDRSTASYASYIEWTCPADGTYYVYVKGYGRDTGTFQFSVTQGAGGLGGVAGGDPCNGGVTLTQANSEISFMPDGNYGDSASCSWLISCPDGSPPTISLEDLDTEAGYDFVTIHEGTEPCDTDDLTGMCLQGETLMVASGDLGANLQRCAGTACIRDRYPDRVTARRGSVVVQFGSDGSVSGRGFAASYVCGRAPPPPPARAPPPPPPASPPPPGLRVTPLRIGGTVRGTITQPGEHIWYSFSARSGDSFQFEVDISTSDGYSLSDSVLDVVDQDRATVLVENDDDPRGIAHGSYASYIEWTAPDDGVYFILVKAFSDEVGTFGLSSTLAGGGGGGGGGSGFNPGTGGEADPCQGAGQSLEQSSASISYMPDGDYTDSLVCHWMITCPARSGNVQVTMTALNTEEDYDFVNLYDGPSPSSSKIDGVSGNLINLATSRYSSTGPSMTVEFASDESIGAGGFSLDYTCAPPAPPPPRRPPPPAPPPPVAPPPPDHVVDTGHQDDYTLRTDGTATPGQVMMGGDQEWYQFSARRGVTYGFETQLTTIDDTIMDLVDTDRQTIIIENDDDTRNGGGFQSYIEWTCPVDGTYYIMVKGYGSSTGAFQLIARSSDSGSGSGSAGTELADPCSGSGATLGPPLTRASVSFMPDGGTQDDIDCKWAITCPGNTMPTITFSEFETESDYDFVKVYDGATTRARLIDQMSGSLTDLRYTTLSATGSTMTVEFTSDGSVGGRGFDAQYRCGTAQAPPPPPPSTPPPPPRGQADSTMHLITADGTQIDGSIRSASDHEWYQFDAVAAHTYQIETTLGTMGDTVIDLVDTDRATVIVENDDDARTGSRTLASYVEWTCPTDGTYYVMVKGYGSGDLGTFHLSVTDAGAAGGIVDPCDTNAGGAMMLGSGTVSFQPNGNYPDNARCDWHIHCTSGHPQVEFTQLATEADWDFVDVRDGPTASGSTLAHLSGQLIDLNEVTYTSSSADMTIEFTSDESVTNGGFEAEYRCR